MKTATIITIGDEILSGNTVDTNSNFIAQQLKDIGIKSSANFSPFLMKFVKLKLFLRIALENSDLVITTGGLGPTKDDKTKKSLCQFFFMMN